MTIQISLVGMPGCGKSTVGRHLARQLGLRFVDSDAEIERRIGMQIRDFFAEHGESAFRDVEQEVIADLSGLGDIVLASGGGAVLRPANRDALYTRTHAFYLRSTPEELFRRLRHDTHRPLLQVADPLRRLRELFRERDPLYRRTAHFVVETSRPSVHALIGMVLMQLELAGLVDPGLVPSPIDASSSRGGRRKLLTMSSTTASVTVATPGSRYDILIGNGLLADPTAWQGLPAAAQALIVSNTSVAPLYAQALQQAIAPHYAQVSLLALPDGEAHKDWTTLNLVFDHLLTRSADRKTVLFALGGGVVGDMTGFAAACYMRGVPFVQVPTTLLAQVDSSVGGKTAINHPLGKNMVGAFYQPQRVVCDLATLDTLSDREMSAGLAEVIKYGPIADADFLGWIEDHLDALRARDRAALAHAVRRCCEIKAAVVGEDERESGLRAILNFGHTFGHAIEAGLGYGRWLHGEAVGCGMLMASELSARLGLMPAAFVDRMQRLIQRAGLPVQAPALGAERYLALMGVDKKAEAGEIRFVVIEALGRAGVRPAPDDMVRQVLATHCTAAA